MIKNILVTGGAGYFGSVLCGALLEKNYNVTCVDRFFFGEEPIKAYLEREYFKVLKRDIRYIGEADFRDIDVVIDLAGLSNDPSCDMDETLTIDINVKGTVNVAGQAKKAGVKQYILASSCSVYGFSKDNMLEEGAEKNPVSLYAKCKLDSECKIKQMASDDFCVTFMRKGTLFGLSNKMRFDLIVNIMTMHAIENRRIIITGQGEQWRPLLHVLDAAGAYMQVIEAEKEIVNGEAFNVGNNNDNYQVKHVASLVQQEIPSAEIIIAPDDKDKRSYNVNFDKITNLLGYKTEHDVTYGINEIKQAIIEGRVSTQDIRTTTVKYYRHLIETDMLLEKIKIDGKLF